MNIQLDYSITIDEFLEMVTSVGWKTYSKEQVEKALRNTMYMVKATVDGKLAEGKNYFWNFEDRGLTETGIYTITISVDAAGVPTAWNVTYDKSKRMAYFLVDPNELAGAVAQPCYSVKKNDGGCDNKFYGNIYLEKDKHCFVVGNIMNLNSATL